MCKEFKKLNEKQYALIFVLSFLLLVLGRILARLISPCFDSLNYGQMTLFFMEVTTCLIWSVCLVVLTTLVYRRYGVFLMSNPATKGKELENRNLIAVILIVAAGILIISAQIGFQVKPFYDMGVKFTGYQLMENVGGLLRNIIKCIWMVLMMECTQQIGEHFVQKKKDDDPEHKIFSIQNIPWGGIVLMLTIGIYDLVCGMTTLKITYLLLNLVYGVIYLCTHKSISKTYICILLIYIL